MLRISFCFFVNFFVRSIGRVASLGVLLLSIPQPATSTTPLASYPSPVNIFFPSFTFRIPNPLHDQVLVLASSSPGASPRLEDHALLWEQETWPVADTQPEDAVHHGHMRPPRPADERGRRARRTYPPRPRPVYARAADGSLFLSLLLHPALRSHGDAIVWSDDTCRWWRRTRYTRFAWTLEFDVVLLTRCRACPLV
jgi:hypothetical protein